MTKSLVDCVRSFLLPVVFAGSIGIISLPQQLIAQDAAPGPERFVPVSSSSVAPLRRWAPTPGIREYRSDAVTLPNGLVIDRRYELPEARMPLLAQWLRTNPERNWDIMPAQGYTGIIQHATEGEFTSDLRTLQTGGKAHFLIPRACSDTVYSIVPLSWTANGAGDSHDRYGPAVARRTIQIENEARESRLLREGAPVLMQGQIECNKKLVNWLQHSFGIRDDDVYTHNQIRVRYFSTRLRNRINRERGPVYFESGLVPDTVVAEANTVKWDGMGFPSEVFPGSFFYSHSGPIDTLRVVNRTNHPEYRVRFRAVLFSVMKPSIQLPDIVIPEPALSSTPSCAIIRIC